MVEDPFLQQPSEATDDDGQLAQLIELKAGVGSGGATINAILIAAENLSAMKRRSMVI